MVYLKVFFFAKSKKNQQTTMKHANIQSGQRIIVMFTPLTLTPELSLFMKRENWETLKSFECWKPLYQKDTLTKSEDNHEIPQNAGFHQCLHFLLRSKQECAYMMSTHIILLLRVGL